MRIRLFPLLAALSVSAVGLAALESDAHACGGCFHVPTDTPTVVTDHRMILSASKGQTTLYDQIRYQGEPSSFAWVLPIVGQVDVGLSSDALFQTLDQATQTQIQAPPRNCPARPNNCPVAESANAGASSSGGTGGVTVLAREVVGPFETVQLRSTDPDALSKWLADNKFSVPDDIKPVISQYVAEKFDFLALKLVPGKGVQDMKPVRVTTAGASAVLPLRMVAAGTGAVVGITLWIVSEGRYEPQNFAWFRIEDNELAWDWTQNRSNYTELRKAKTDAGGGKVWEIENSIEYGSGSVTSAIGRFGVTAEEVAGYAPVKDAQGKVIKTATQARDEDIAVLFSGVTPTQSRVTRIRADLSRAGLATDLLLKASSDQALLPTVRQATKELNSPQCPVFADCTQVGTAPREEAAAQNDPNAAPVAGGKTLCTTSSTSSTQLFEPMTVAALAGFLGLVVSRRRKR